MRNQVLIVSQIFEPSVDAVISHFVRMGVNWVRINCEEFPILCEASVAFKRGAQPWGILRFNGNVLDSRNIGSVWFRRVALSAVPKGLSPKDRDFVQNECRAYLNGFFDLLDCSWINDRQNERSASSKANQLRIANDIGLTIPRTLITNDMRAVEQFANEVHGQVLFKPVSGFAPRNVNFIPELAAAASSRLRYELEDSEYDETETDVVFSQLLTEEKIKELESLDFCPAIFQEYIEKRAEIRVTVVGEETFACEIDSQSRDETRVDFRRMALLGSATEVAHRIHSLPSDIAEKLMLMMRSLGIRFGCFDLIVKPDGEYVFLEVNPSGQWLWIEQILGCRISDALASLLARPTKA